MDANVHYLELAITISVTLFTAAFTIGGFYYYVPKELARLRADLVELKADAEEKGKERKDQLEAKIDKNYESLEKKIDRNEASCKQDLSGIGGKVTHYERQTQRRYHNMSAAVLMAAPADLEKEIGQLLKEEAS